MQGNFVPLSPYTRPDWGEIYDRLLQEPYSFSLADLAGMTDEQLIGLFGKDRPLRRRRRPSAPADGPRLSFRQSFLADVMACQGRSREDAEALFVRLYPDHKDP